MEVDGCSSIDGVEGHHLESDAGCNRKSVEITEEGGHNPVFTSVKCSMRLYQCWVDF